MNASLVAAFLALLLVADSVAADDKLLPDTQPLTGTNDFSMEMIASIDRFLDRELAASVERRAAKWHRDFSSPEAYAKSVEPNRERFKKIIGVVDEREKSERWDYFQMRQLQMQPVAECTGYKVHIFRWNPARGIEGQGLWLEPEGSLKANVIALGDCDWTPEVVAGVTYDGNTERSFAGMLAANGCRVIVPVLMDRRDNYSGNPKLRMTNQPHREFIYRAAFEMGRHIIGYEVQKVLYAIDELEIPVEMGRAYGTKEHPWKPLPLGIIGYGEGGLIALHAAAVDTRIKAACVSGYFSAT